MELLSGTILSLDYGSINVHIFYFYIIYSAATPWQRMFSICHASSVSVFSLSQYTFTFIRPSGLISRPSNISVPTTLSFRLELYYSAFKNKTDLQNIPVIITENSSADLCKKSLYDFSLTILSQLHSVCEVPHL